MVAIPPAPLEGSSLESVDNMPMPFMTQTDGASGLQAVLLSPRRTATLAAQLLGVLNISRVDNVAVTPFESEARPDATDRTYPYDLTTSDFVNEGARGLILTLDVTAIVSSPSIVLRVEQKPGTFDPTSGVYTYETVFLAATPVTAVGTHTYLIYPDDIIIGADFDDAVKLPLPRTWRVVIEHADADSITYSVGGSYLV